MTAGADRSPNCERKYLHFPDFRCRDLFYAPLDGSQSLVDFKAALYRAGKNSRFRQKVVGVIGSSGRAGQAAQAAGSIVLPGNISPVRSPVRSGIGRAVTPGGGGRSGVNVPNVGEGYYRCGEGFQFGGRFTDENYSTCGRQLFDIPSLRETLGQALFRTRSLRSATSPGSRGNVEVIQREALGDRDLVIRRALRVTEVGEGNDKAREDGIVQAIQAVQNLDNESSVIVRRDGFNMIPVVPIDVIRDVPDNRNMEGAAFVKSVRDPETIGTDELKLLSNTGVTSLIYVTPNGVQIRVDRTRDLESGERRQLGKDANAAQDIDVSEDPLARLDYIVEKTDGAFTLSTDFGDVKDPEERSSARDANGLPNWAYEAFKNAPDERTEEPSDLTEEGAPAEAPAAAAQNVAPVERTERIDSVREAVEHLNNNGLLSEIDPSIVLEALERSDRYKSQTLRDDITLFTSDDGKKVISKDNNEDFEHISAHLTSEVLRELGVQAPTVRFADEGDDRPFFYRSPDSVVEGAETTADFEPDEVPPEQIIGTQIADWLTDTRGRTSNSLFAAEVNGERELVVGIGPKAALVGLDQDEIEARRRLVLGEFFQETTENYGRRFEGQSAEQNQLVVQIIDSLIARAQAFSWDDYVQKLSIDGSLSEAEQRHLEIVKGIFDSRLESLNASKELILQILGVTT